MGLQFGWIIKELKNDPKEAFPREKQPWDRRIYKVVFLKVKVFMSIKLVYEKRKYFHNQKFNQNIPPRRTFCAESHKKHTPPVCLSICR